MIQYYKKSLIDLFIQIRELHSHPLKESGKCLFIQETLLKKILYIEKRIVTLKKLTKEAKKQLAVKRSAPFAKEMSAKIKTKIEHNRQAIKDYQELLQIFRCIGDALAYIYIPKWNIKPLTFKESAGFLSGKEGLKQEKRLLREVFKINGVAILNDVTNNIRYGDITIIDEDGITFTEVKTSTNVNERGKRQLDKLIEIETYLNTDESRDYFRKGLIKRKAAHSEDRHYRTELNQLIENAMKNGSSFAEVEEGLFYFVDTGFDTEKFLSIFSNFQTQPKLFFLNQFKPSILGHYPFTLSIRNPEALFAFYAGQLIINILIDTEVFVKKFAARGLLVKFVNGKEEALTIYQIPQLNSNQFETNSFS